MTYAIPIYYFILSFTFIALIWNRKDYKGYYLYLLLLLTSTIITEVIRNSFNTDYSQTAENFYSLTETVLILLVYRSVIKNNKTKQVIKWSVPIFILFFIVEFSIEGRKGESIFFMAGSHLYIIILGIIYSISTLSPPFKDKLFRKPFFWINTANLLYFAGFFLYLGLHNYIFSITGEKSIELTVLSVIINFLFYILYTIGFLCRRIFK